MFNSLIYKHDFHSNKSVALTQLLTTILFLNPERSTKRTLPLFDLTVEEGPNK